MEIKKYSYYYITSNIVFEVWSILKGKRGKIIYLIGRFHFKIKGVYSSKNYWKIKDFNSYRYETYILPKYLTNYEDYEDKKFIEKQNKLYFDNKCCLYKTNLIKSLKKRIKLKERWKLEI